VLFRSLPWKIDLFTAIVAGAVKEAERAHIPVTIKMRRGIDEEHLTYIEAARRAVDVGVSAVALHGRTMRQHYSGEANWDSIARLKEAITDVPVLGNGDIWSAEDAMAMIEYTGADGVVIGRGCQGRPWLFGDVQNAFTGSDQRFHPDQGTVADVLSRHAELLGETCGVHEDKVRRDIRKHVSWNCIGYPVGVDMRRSSTAVETQEQLRELWATVDRTVPYPGADAEGPRGRAGAPKNPHLPEGWLDSQDITDEHRAQIHEAELDISGG